jgi:hypothetical protein
VWSATSRSRPNSFWIWPRWPSGRIRVLLVGQGAGTMSSFTLIRCDSDDRGDAVLNRVPLLQDEVVDGGEEMEASP